MSDDATRAPKRDWPIHARMAWEHERKRGDRLYQALCAMERERDRMETALRAVVTCESPYRLDPLDHARDAVAHCQAVARAALAADTP